MVVAAPLRYDDGRYPTMIPSPTLFRRLPATLLTCSLIASTSSTDLLAAFRPPLPAQGASTVAFNEQAFSLRLGLFAPRLGRHAKVAVVQIGLATMIAAASPLLSHAQRPEEDKSVAMEEIWKKEKVIEALRQPSDSQKLLGIRQSWNQITDKEVRVQLLACLKKPALRSEALLALLFIPRMGFIESLLLDPDSDAQLRMFQKALDDRDSRVRTAGRIWWSAASAHIREPKSRSVEDDPKRRLMIRSRVLFFTHDWILSELRQPSDALSLISALRMAANLHLTETFSSLEYYVKSDAYGRDVPNAAGAALIDMEGPAALPTIVDAEVAREGSADNISVAVSQMRRYDQHEIGKQAARLVIKQHAMFSKDPDGDIAFLQSVGYLDQQEADAYRRTLGQKKSQPVVLGVLASILAGVLLAVANRRSGIKVSFSGSNGYKTKERLASS